MTQTENDLATLCQIQTDELTKLRGERADAMVACRDLLRTIAAYQVATSHPPQEIGVALAKAKARACQILAAQLTEDG